jgi:hypothetical protein
LRRCRRDVDGWRDHCAARSIKFDFGDHVAIDPVATGEQDVAFLHCGNGAFFAMMRLASD